MGQVPKLPEQKVILHSGLWLPGVASRLNYYVTSYREYMTDGVLGMY